jgi:hypothetical protein
MTNRMRGIMQCRTIVCVAVLGFAAVAGAQTAGWKSYRYPADGFQASYPSAPEIQKKNVPTETGTFELHAYIAQDSDVALYVGVIDYGSATAGKTPDNLLQGAKNAALKSSSSHLVSEKKISLGAYPGLEFETVSDAVHITFRVYMVGSTLYQTLVVMPLGMPYTNTIQFLDSFQLIAKTGN